MIRRPPRSTRTYTLCPYTTLFRSSKCDRPCVRLRFLSWVLRENVAIRRRAQSRPDPRSPEKRRFANKKWLGRMDSNLRMTGSKPVALPLGDAPTEHPDMTVCLRMGANYSSEARRVGKECVGTWRTRWSPFQ